MSERIWREPDEIPPTDMGESEAKAPETADQPVESAARRQPGTKYEAVAQASQVAHHYIVLTPRDLSLIRFALHRLMERAYWLAAAAAQDIRGRHFKPGDAEAFLKDAKDAEALLGRLKGAEPVALELIVDEQQERAAFEAAAKGRMSLVRTWDDEGYDSPFTRGAYVGWKLARAAQVQRPPVHRRAESPAVETKGS